MDTINVKITRVPGTPIELVLNGNRTVADALSAAEKNLDGFDIKVNGSPADLTTQLTEGDVILLVKPIRGN